MARKIGQQARRTRRTGFQPAQLCAAVAGRKDTAGHGVVVQRALQMKMLRTDNKNIRVESRIAPDLPQIWGNVNQLFQCCVEIIGNATDALEEVGGGTFLVSVLPEGDELVMEFSDSGPGMRDPQRIFDPFYTTKASRQGYGTWFERHLRCGPGPPGPDHCENRPEGGAVFTLRFPVAKQSVPRLPKPPGVEPCGPLAISPFASSASGLNRFRS